ncbi:hypothetical protein FBY10_101122 [Pseudomonas sp. SJZ103]|uniref:hypothetical protein n=1 Tax=unclassified Pseudomonas TaxID=196821 RepID=UPI00119CE551|nr:MULTISPECIES: hypothetical protein [unclassified Pseudomonas]TWC74432.1 hypothetical protein FBY10_101122 [Pseudomonas sp. SJZ103]TWC93439.1 hypothetical protein FBY08_101936 [Pseudomonas sp. SJZ094]
MTKTLIEFQDHQQDFLVWTVDESGIVTRSWPYHTDLWAGVRIVNLASLKVGGMVEFFRDGDTRDQSIKYPIRSIQPLVPAEVSVRQDGDGYVTSTVRGKRVSCTHDYEYPVKRLAEKLFPGLSASVERLPCTPFGRLHSKWRITPLEVV